MKPLFLITCLALCCGTVKPQSKGNDFPRQFSSQITPFAGASAQEQASIWQQEAISQPQNANAWVNYALWTQRNTAMTAAQKKAQLAQISNKSKNYISASGEWQLIRFLQSNKTDSAAISEAVEKMSNPVIAYPFAIQSAIIRQNAPDLKKYCNSFLALQPLDQNDPIWQYHNNVLLSAPQNATIAAAGENDLVPMAMLQQTKNVRPDIKLVYYDAATVSQYSNVFLCLSLPEDVLSKYRQTGSFRGLLLNISGKPETGMPGNIVPGTMNMEYLKYTDFSGQVALLNNNYLPCLLLAYRYCKKNNDSRTGQYKQLLEKIAREGGKQDAITAAMDKP